MSTPTPRTTTTDHGYQVARVAIDSTTKGCRDIATVVDQAKAVLGTSWTGGAGRTFGSAADAWLTKLYDLIASIEEMGGVLESNRYGMATVEDDSILAASGFAARVNPR